MKKILVSISLVLIGLAAVSPLYGEDFIKVKGKYWNSKIDGDFKADTKLVQGTKLDLSSTLDLDDTASVPEVELKLKVPIVGKIIASYATSSYEGKKTLTNGINYGGITYNASELVKTELDLTLGSLLVEKVFVPEFITRAFPSVAEAEAGFLFGIKYLKAETSIKSSLNTADEDGAAPIPVIGFFLQMGFMKKMMNVELGAVGFKATISDIEAEYVDFYAEVKTNLFKPLPFGIGYKMNRLNLTDSDAFDINLTLSGLYLFASAEF